MNKLKSEKKTLVVVCKHEGCCESFLYKKHRNHYQLCKKHRNIGYKKTHMLKKKELANQILESKKVFSGTDALIGQPLSSYLSQVLQQKRKGLLKSPEVIDFLKKKQNKIKTSRLKSNSTESRTVCSSHKLDNKHIKENTPLIDAVCSDSNEDQGIVNCAYQNNSFINETVCTDEKTSTPSGDTAIYNDLNLPETSFMDNVPYLSPDSTYGSLPEDPFSTCQRHINKGFSDEMQMYPS